MEWNNGKERRKFEREQAQLREQYLAAGMTEEQIKQLYECDLEWYKSRRREARHTQSLDFVVDEDGEVRKDNPLYKKFADKLTVEDRHFLSSDEAWLDDMKNEKLYKAIRSLSESDRELLTDLFSRGLSQKEIALKRGVKKAALSRKVSRLKLFLRKFL